LHFFPHSGQNLAPGVSIEPHGVQCWACLSWVQLLAFRQNSHFLLRADGTSARTAPDVPSGVSVIVVLLP